MNRLLLTFLFCLISLSANSGEIPGNFRKENLVAWCIVPFDAKKRGPEARAEMVHALGINRVAYDWRKEHIPTFEEEILAYQKHGIEMFAFWGGHEDAFALFGKYKIHPQIWRTLSGEKGDSQEEKVQSAADAMEPLAKRSGEAGCALGLYNHGGWGGEPDNLIAVCRELRKRGHGHVGIVYNFHHAHDHLENWGGSFAAMKPYLLCLNLNGMIPGGDKAGKKILTIGEGTREATMIKAVIESGYDGPIGILDHRNETDSAETLQENLDGLEIVLAAEE
jgi:hypothetical protein